MKKIFMVGYYGQNNFGDDLLLKSFIKVLCEIKFDGLLSIPFDKEWETPKEKLTFQIQKINKFDFLNLSKHIKSSDIVIFGGGNLFQTETSFRSFYYYYYVAKTAVTNNKPFLLLSQGFGPMKNKYAHSLLKKILKNEKTTAVFRDKTSYIYSRRYNSSSFLGTDIAPYAINVRIKNNIKKENKISICLKNNYENMNDLIKFVSLFDNYDISTLIINSNQDTMMNYNFVEKLRDENHLEASFPIKETEKVLEEIQTSSIVISDRLHSSLISIYSGGITLTYRNSKNIRVLKTIDENYNFFYKNLVDLPKIYFDLKEKEFDFEIMSKNFDLKVYETIKKIKEIIQNVL